MFILNVRNYWEKYLLCLVKRYYKNIVVGASISTNWFCFAHPSSQFEWKAAKNQGAQEIILNVLIEPQTNKALWISPHTPCLIFKLLWLVYLFTDLKELRLLEFLVDILTFLEEQQVCNPRPSLFVFLCWLQRHKVRQDHTHPLNGYDSHSFI